MASASEQGTRHTMSGSQIPRRPTNSFQTLSQADEITRQLLIFQAAQSISQPPLIVINSFVFNASAGNCENSPTAVMVGNDPQSCQVLHTNPNSSLKYRVKIINPQKQ